MPRHATPTDIAQPRSFEARYGEGVDRGLCLGGGGLFFVAWQVAYLDELATAGADLGAADRVVGTSAGSVVATALTAGKLPRLRRELAVLARAPKLVAALAPAAGLAPSQDRALEAFRIAADGDPATLRAIGHAALAAATPAPATMRRNIALLTGVRGWPSPALRITCVDTFTGDRCVVTDRSGVAAPTAAAASSAVPGLFAPQVIGDRRCMDGGVSGTGLHLDLLGGAGRVLVLGLSDGGDVIEGMMTTAPGAIRAELDALAATGTRVELRVPEEVDPDELMAPEAVPRAVAMGRRQARADRELVSFWS